MTEPKDIGKVFKEKLQDFNQSPSKLSWEDIEPMLPKKKNTRPSNWIKASGILLSLLLLTFVTYKGLVSNSYNLNQDNEVTKTTTIENNCIDITDPKYPFKNNVVNKSNTIEDTQIDTNDRLDNLTENNYNSFSKRKNNNSGTAVKENYITSFTNTLTYNSELKKQTLSNNIRKSKKRNKQETNRNKVESNFSPLNTNILSSDSAISLANNSQSTKNSQHGVKYLKEQPINQSNSKKNRLVKNNKEKDSLTQTTPTKNKFRLGLYTTPTYLITSKGSLIDEGLADFPNNGRISLGYGVLFKTYFTERIALRITYNRLKLSNRTDDLTTQQIPSSIRDKWSLQTTNDIIENSGKLGLLQKLTYNEISLGLQYDITNQLIQTSLVTGVNFILISENNIVIKTNSNDFTITDNDNILKANIGVHLGSNFGYKLSKRVSFNVTPLINYQFKNASKNQNSYKLLYLTLQTGFSYGF